MYQLKIILMLLICYSTITTSNEINKYSTIDCFGTLTSLPKEFTLTDRLLITHTWHRGCGYSTIESEDSPENLSFHIENDFTLQQYSSEFTESEKNILAKYAVLHAISNRYTFGNLPTYFEEKYSGKTYFCYKEIELDNRVELTTKECFTFFSGFIINVGYRHSSTSDISIEILEKAIFNLRRRS